MSDIWRTTPYRHAHGLVQRNRVWAKRRRRRPRRVFKRLKQRMGGGLHIELPGVDELVVVNVTATFWDGCSEFRSAKIGAWMKGRGDLPWLDSQPPKYTAELLWSCPGSVDG